MYPCVYSSLAKTDLVRRTLMGSVPFIKLVGSVTSAIFCWDECGITIHLLAFLDGNTRDPNLSGFFSPNCVPTCTDPFFIFVMDECAAALECVSQFALKTSSDYKNFRYVSQLVQVNK